VLVFALSLGARALTASPSLNLCVRSARSFPMNLWCTRSESRLKRTLLGEAPLEGGSMANRRFIVTPGLKASNAMTFMLRR
jgi:hypothetical protein